MGDFNFVTPRIATGGALRGPSDVQAIVNAGITHIVDCRAEFDDTALFTAHSDVSVLWNGTPDDGAHKSADWFGKGILFVMSAYNNPKFKFLAHCSAGVNRGPSQCYAIMRALGFAQSDAEHYIRSARPQVGLRYKADADEAVKQLGWAP